MERAYLLGTIAAVCGTGSMDLFVDNPLLPSMLCALVAAVLMRQVLVRVDGFVDATADIAPMPNSAQRS